MERWLCGLRFSWGIYHRLLVCGTLLCSGVWGCSADTTTGEETTVTFQNEMEPYTVATDPLRALSYEGAWLLYTTVNADVQFLEELTGLVEIRSDCLWLADNPLVWDTEVDIARVQALVQRLSGGEALQIAVGGVARELEVPELLGELCGAERAWYVNSRGWVELD